MGCIRTAMNSEMTRNKKDAQDSEIDGLQAYLLRWFLLFMCEKETFLWSFTWQDEPPTSSTNPQKENKMEKQKNSSNNTAEITSNTTAWLILLYIN